MSVPIVYAASAKPEDVRKAESALGGYIGPFELRVPLRFTCPTCGPQEWSKDDAYIVCPVCGGPGR